MNDNKGLFGSTLGKVGDLTQQFGKGVSEEVKKTGQSTAAQIGLENKVERAEGTSPEAAKEAENPASDKANEDFVKAMYGVDSNKDTAQLPAQKQNQTKANEDNPDAQLFQSLALAHPSKTQEELQKMLSEYKQQHKEEYYDKVFNPPKPKEEAVTEKIEREDNEERWKLQEEEKKKPKGAPTPGVNPFEKSPESKQGAKIMG